KQSPMLHRLNYKAAHSSHAFLQNPTFRQLPILCRCTHSQFAPDLFLTPLADVFIRLALQIQSANGRASHAQERESPLVQRVDQLVRRWRSLRQNSKPSKRILSLINSQRRGWNAGPANAVKAVAPSDKVAGQFVTSAVL